MQLQRVTYRGSGGVQRALLPGLFTDTHEFRFSDDDGAMQVETIDFGSIGAMVARVRSTGHMIRLTEQRRFSMLLPQTGRLEIEAAGKTHMAQPRTRFLSAPASGRLTRTGPDAVANYFAFVVLAPAQAIKLTVEVPTAVIGRRSHRNLRFDPAREAAAYYLAFLSDGPASPRPVPAKRAVAAAERLLIEMFREALAVAERTPQTAPCLARIVDRAEAFMNANYAGVIGMADIAAAAGLGLRWLQQAFRAVRGHSPREALNRIRMEEARRLLLVAPPDASVTGIALDCGFTHLSRFAGGYRALYGEAPSETLRRDRRNRVGR